VKKKESEIRNAMRYCTTEGSLATIFQYLSIGDNCSGPFIIGLALYLGTNDIMVALLGAIPYAFQFTQLIAALVVQRIGKRRKFVAFVTLAARSPMLILAFLPLMNFLTGNQKIVVLFTVLIFHNINALMSGNAWTSWVSDIFPEQIRGRYFGFRNGILSLVKVITIFLAGLILDYFISHGKKDIGFTTLFGSAAIAGICTSFVLMKHPERKTTYHPTENFLQLTLIPLKNPEFRKILTFFFLWNLAIGISAAFNAVHMIRNLQMDFSHIALFQIMIAGGSFFTSKIWGRFIDKYGSKSVLLTNAIFISLIPIIWLFPTKTTIWPIYIDPVMTSIFWTGFNLAAFTFPIAASPKEQRGFYLAVFNLSIGMGYLLASVVGGIIAQTFHDFHLHVFGLNFVNLHILFAMSAFLRMVSTINLSRIKEPKEIGAALMIQFMSATFDKISLYTNQALPLFLTIPKQIVKTAPIVGTVALKITDEIIDRVDEFSDEVENISSGIANIIMNISTDLTSKIGNVSDNISGIFIHLADRQKNISNFKINWKREDDDDDDTRTDS